MESAQRAYEQLQQRINQTSLESQTTQSNANVLTQATPPIEPATANILPPTLKTVTPSHWTVLVAAGSLRQ